MHAVTVHHGVRTQKPFSWSYSKLKNYRTCPKRHYEVDLQRNFKEEEGDNLIWGNEVHKALAARIKDGTPLPATMIQYEHWVEKIVTSEGNIQVEQKYAIDASFGPCAYFAPSAWYRAIGDVVKLNGPVALVADWKTGKIIEDSEQLALTAACLFAHYPELQAVRSEFIWLKEDANTSLTMMRGDMPTFWRGIWPSVQELEHAYKTTTYPAKPSGICKRWCPVSSCPHHGEGR